MPPLAPVMAIVLYMEPLLEDEQSGDEIGRGSSRLRWQTVKVRLPHLHQEGSVFGLGDLSADERDALLIAYVRDGPECPRTLHRVPSIAEIGDGVLAERVSKRDDYLRCLIRNGVLRVSRRKVTMLRVVDIVKSNVAE